MHIRNHTKQINANIGSKSYTGSLLVQTIDILSCIEAEKSTFLHTYSNGQTD